MRMVGGGAIATYHTPGDAPLAYPAVSLRSKSKQRDTAFRIVAVVQVSICFVRRQSCSKNGLRWGE